MKVDWSKRAIRQLAGIYERIAEDSEGAAARFLKQLTLAPRQLETFPRSGRVVHESEAGTYREIGHKSYRILYRVLSDRVEITAVIHSKRDFDTASLDL